MEVPWIFHPEDKFSLSVSVPRHGLIPGEETTESSIVESILVGVFILIETELNRGFFQFMIFGVEKPFKFLFGLWIKVECQIVQSGLVIKRRTFKNRVMRDGQVFFSNGLQLSRYRASCTSFQDRRVFLLHAS